MVAADHPQATGLAVKFLGETIVKPTDPTSQPGTFPISNLDRLVGGIPLLVFYAYRKPSTADLPAILSTVKTSLSEALNHFFPFAGEIIHTPTGEAEILCNNKGVRLLQASANVSLSKLDFYSQNTTIRNIVLPIYPTFPLTVQVTSYSCGGFSISWSFDHLLADASGIIKFLSAWCEIARTKKKLSTVFSVDRGIFCPRSPPRYNQQLIERNYSVCSMDDLLEMPLNCATERYLYFVKGSTLESLRAAASEGGSKRTRTVALSAYLWKLLAKTFDNGEYTTCRMGWSVDGRKRIDGDSEKMLNFVGNVVSMATGEATMEDLKEGPLAYVAGIASKAIDEVANRAHFLDLIDWVECNRPEKMMPDVVLARSTPAIVVSSCHNMPFMSMDLGFGLPSVGMFCSAMDKLCAGYVNMVSSGRGDGSWFVSAFICAELAREIQLDPNHVFEPITADRLGL